MASAPGKEAADKAQMPAGHAQRGEDTFGVRRIKTPQIRPDRDRTSQRGRRTVWAQQQGGARRLPSQCRGPGRRVYATPRRPDNASGVNTVSLSPGPSSQSIGTQT